MTIDDTLQEMVARALQEADASGDFLIAALLSQCVSLLEERGSPQPN